MKSFIAKPVMRHFDIFKVRTLLYNIQVLTGTVMKYHVSVDCQENYIYFPEVRSTQGKYNYLGTTDT